MIRLLALLACFTVILPAIAQADEIPVESEIRAATVYPNRATVTREAVADLPEGSHTLIFNGLPANLLTDSLRAEGSAGIQVTFGALTHRQVMASDLTAPREQALNEQLQTLEDRRALIEAEKKALGAQLSFLENLGEQAALRSDEEIARLNLQPDQWIAAARAIHGGVGDILRATHAQDMALRDINNEIRQVRNELNQLRTGQRSTHQVRIPVETSAATQLTVALSYQVPNATWKPVYDARLDTDNGTLEITQFGAVRQNTGEDWTDITLTLSTAQPHRGAGLPDLSPMWVDIFDPQARQFRGERAAIASMDMAAESTMAMSKSAPPQAAQFAAAEIVTGGFVSEYRIPGPATVPADGSESKLMVGRFDTESQLAVHIKPQVSRDAFVVAQARLRGEAPLLPGQASLFRDGAYVGQAEMPMLRPGETHDLPFGIDDQIAVTRNIIRDQRSEAGLIARDNVLERHFVTEVQNLHRRAMDVIIYETIPVGRDERIRTEIVRNVTTAGFQENVDNIRGLLRWQQTLEPQQQVDIGLGWRVNWPKDLSLSGL